MKTSIIGYLFAASLMCYGIQGNAQQPVIQHVEPPFWWVGMKNTSLQIMVHGQDIGQSTPEVRYTGIRIDSLVRPANQNYLFLYLNTQAGIRPGSFDIRFLRKGKLVATYSYSLLARAEGSERRSGFNTSDVIYLITPDRFANGDKGNDSSPLTMEAASRNNKNGRHGGDIKGVIDHLDYIRDMGYTAIWLNPVVENNQPAVSYHGYSATDFYKTDPRFGTNDDYVLLSREASKKGMKLIMDQVMNHCGSGHWWLKDLPYPDWLRTTENALPTNHRRSTYNDPYAAKTDQDQFEKGWFVPTMPDMNQDNPHLANYLIQNSIWWIENAGLGGIRHDTHPYAGARFMSEWTCAIMGEYADFNIVGEEWSESPAIVSKWQRGYKGNVDLHSCLPSLMDFPVQMAVSKALIEKETWSDGFIKLYEMLANDFLYPDPFSLVIFPDNHDMNRFYTQMKEDLGLFKLGITFFLTTRGIPQIYYGTEILMTNGIQGDHGLIRTDFPGGWPGDAVNGFTGAGLTSDQIETQAFMKKLLNWRKTAEVIHHGKLMHYSPANGVYVYFRYTDNQKIMVVLNKNEESVDLDASRYPEMLKKNSSFTDILSGKQFLDGKIHVPGRTPLILQVN